jgi:hypothetical protein
LVQCPMAIVRLKCQKSNIRHDGVLSIGDFMLMINNHFARFQLPGVELVLYLLKTKKMCSLFPWQHGISYLFLLLFSRFMTFFGKKTFKFFGVKPILSIYSIYDESKNSANFRKNKISFVKIGSMIKASERQKLFYQVN